MSPELYAGIRAAADAMSEAIRLYDAERQTVREGMQRQLDAFLAMLAAHDEATGATAPSDATRRRGRKTNAERQAARIAEAEKLAGVAWSELSPEQQAQWGAEADKAIRARTRQRGPRAPAPTAPPSAAPSGNARDPDAPPPGPRGDPSFKWPAFPGAAPN